MLGPRSKSDFFGAVSWQRLYLISMTKHLFLFTLVFGLGSLSLAAGRATFTSIHQNYQSIRAAGMGGAFAAVANDETAIFYNPAVFARFTEGKMQGVLLDASVTDSFSIFANNISNAVNSGNPLTIANFLQGEMGHTYYGRLKLIEMSWVRPNWGVTFIPADFSLDLQMDNYLYNDGNPVIPDSPPLNLRYFLDTTLAFSYAGTIKNESFGLLNIGTTLKGILRQYMNRNIKVDDPSTSITDADKTDGLGYDVDVGMLFTPYLPEGEGWNWLRAMKPTFALVGRNLLDSGFSNKMILKSSTFEPEKLYRVYDFGMRFEIPQFWIFGGRFAIDQRDMGHPYANARRSFHAGFEFDWTMTSWWKGQWRVGSGQGYASAGFSALFSVFRLDLATYGEDVGTLSTPKENRIYQLKMSGEF